MAAGRAKKRTDLHEKYDNPCSHVAALASFASRMLTPSVT
jgi:hypothetical protein